MGRKAAKWLMPFTALAFLLMFFVTVMAKQAVENGSVTQLKIEGPIGPAITEYIDQGYQKAKKTGAQFVVIKLDTPGGLARSMRTINQKILNATRPTVVFVAPRGARAASAGTFMLYAADVAAMAPGTSVGAASPVKIGGSNPKAASNPAKAQKQQSDQSRNKREKKAMKDAIAYIQSLAQLHDRNKQWAKQAVLNAETLSAQKALQKNVINFKAKNIDELLKQLDGYQIDNANRKTELKTGSLTIESFEQDWRIEFLSIITDPSIAYLLLMIGIWLVFFELIQPGLILPGVSGVISILAGVYGLAMLPVDYVGILLMTIGLGFMIAEAFITAYGLMGIGGVIAFTFGSIMLMDTTAPGFQISLPLILLISLLTALFFFMIAYMIIRAHQNPVVSGQSWMVGQIGTIAVDENQHKWLKIRGEYWQIDQPDKFIHNQRVKVVKADAHYLKVEPIES
jgi:membrane-bound serine protease (ClpP class)